jgi:3-deoxy-manno-octulosonate cytidylyltransferase (CMP-KDO synthetase)
MILGIIPARYASTRFPGKPLIDLAGKTMIRRVYEQAIQCKRLQKVVVATDDERIRDEVLSFGGNVVMTANHHPSGTDRCLDAFLQQEESFHYVINIQGDEPFIEPEQIDLLASVLKHHNAQLATLVMPVNDTEVLTNPNKVKVVMNTKKEALYFSRAAIPFLKNLPIEEWVREHNYYQHIGIYAYRTDILKEITKLQVSSLEHTESLEQLRWLENGYSIQCAITNHESLCIDTPEDVAAVLAKRNLHL